MTWLKKIRDFLDGCLDYENPSAGCCKSISAIPGINNQYKRLCDKDEDVE